MASPFNRAGERTLVLRAVPCNPPSDDLSFLGQKFAETFDFFIIDVVYFLAAKTADFLSKETPAERTPFTITVAVAITFTSPRTGALIVRAQKGTSSSGESSSLEIWIGPSFFGDSLEGSDASSAIGSSGS